MIQNALALFLRVAMISRRSALSIAKAYQLQFRKYSANARQSTQRNYHSDSEILYYYLFEREYESWFCNLAKKCSIVYNSIFQFVALLHTGESILKATVKWTLEQRQKKGQQLLKKLAEHFINDWNSKWFPEMRRGENEWNYSLLFPKKLEKENKERKEHYAKLMASLELDGYSYRGSKLLYSERDVLDIQEEQGILAQLYTDLNLRNGEITFRDLARSDEHYMDGKWEDSISNSRKFLESVMMEVAAAYSRIMPIAEIDAKDLEKPYKVREYLERQGLINATEKEAFAKVYGLLSHIGSHPNMAAKDQARLLRQLSLTLAQFIMLRLQGS